MFTHIHTCIKFGRIFFLLICMYNSESLLWESISFFHRCLYLSKSFSFTSWRTCLWFSKFNNEQLWNATILRMSTKTFLLRVTSYFSEISLRYHVKRELHVFFTIHSGVSSPLIVLIHVTWIVYKKSFSNSNQWQYFLVTLYRIC